MTKKGTAPLGVIAGSGKLPLLLIKEAKSNGARVVAIVFEEESVELLKDEVDAIYKVGLAQAGKTISTLKKEGVQRVVFIGKVDKRYLFKKNPMFDFKALSILAKVAFKNDDSLMNGIINALNEEGLTIEDQASLLKKMMPPAGLIAGVEPTEEERRDIDFGLKMAKGIAALDIGQTVVVKDTAVLAVEAIEGTDEAILRGGAIANGSAVVCKVAKPNQDERFDLPTVGVETLEVMSQVDAKILAIEAGKTVVVGIEDMKIACKDKGIMFISSKAGNEQ